MSQVILYPGNQTPFLNPDGTVTQSWLRYLIDLYQKTGGSGNATVQSLSVQVDANTVEADTANSNASLALVRAQVAQTTASQATVLANQAIQIASAGSSAAGNFLSKNLNLSDLGNAATARTNLSVATFPVTFMFDTLPGGLVRYYPLTRAYNMPSNFGGTVTWAGTVPFANSVFSVAAIRAGVVIPIGTITLIHSGNFNSLSGIPIVLQAGDILSLTCPNPADTNLANVGISISLNLA